MNKRLIAIVERYRETLGFEGELATSNSLDSLGFDSLDRATLLSEIDREFGISIADDRVSGATTLGVIDTIVSEASTAEEEATGFVDLGLTSGTLWAKNNAEHNGKKLFDFDEAIGLFGDQMPTAAQAVELATECTHEWVTENGKPGMKFTGPNGKSIFFPADGYTWKGGPVKYDGDEGDIWTKTPSVNYSAANACRLGFSAGGVYPLNFYYRASGFSVRPVR